MPSLFTQLAIVLGLVLVIFPLENQAALHPVQVVPGKVSAPMRTGATIGGRASDEFSLLAVRRESLDSGGERVIVLFGDRHGKPLKGEPGYFHVSLEKDARRIVLDFAQMQRTAVDPTRLAKILSPSRLIHGTDMTMDPVDGSTNIILRTREPVEIKIGAAEGEPSRMFVDLVPIVKEKR